MNGFNAAPEKNFLYVMHAAREKIFVFVIVKKLRTFFNDPARFEKDLPPCGP